MEAKLSLTQDGVEMIDYPTTTQQHVAAAAAAWQQFLTLSDMQKHVFAATDLQSGVGYEKKGSGERESRDIKENFDITAQSLPVLTAQATHESIAATFIASATLLFDDLQQMIIRYGEHVESTYGITGFAAEAASSAPSAFVRFLYYPPVPLGTIIGEPHVDHSGFTFHLYESTGGCDRLAYDHKIWLPMPVASDKAAAFASMQTQLFSYNAIRGLCHRITADEITSQIGRTAIVCFVPLVHMPRYDRPRHGRLQDMQPGFNYDMAFSEFGSYFTSTQK